jgi:homoserine/homoserine lactone efflux protein
VWATWFGWALRSGGRQLGQWWPCRIPGEVVTQRALILKAWLINIVNPKGTVFLLAVVPQFINPAQPLLQQYLIIGATLAFTDLVVMTGYTALAAKVLGALKEPAHIRAMNRIFGSLFVLAGSLLALFKRSA